MTKLFLSLLFVAGFAVAAQAGNPDNGVTKVNVAASKIEWTARKVTGKHNGLISIKKGNLDIKDGYLVGGTFTIDMPSITVTDLSGESKGKLEGHLKSDDFFAVATYPEATMKITQVNALGEGDYDIKADFTIKGKTNPITFKAQLIPDGKKYKATANITIDRSLYDVKYGSGKFFEGLGDNTIYDDFDLAISLVTE